MKSPRIVRVVALLLIATGSLRAAPPLNFGEVPGGWQFVSPGKADIHSVCELGADGALSVAGKPVGYLVTAEIYQNYKLHLEWRWSGEAGNGGLLLNVSSAPKDREWPTCLQVQLKNTRAGDLLPMAGARFAELPTPAAKELARHGKDSEKPVGQWNSCDVVCHLGAISCSINGVPQNAVTHCIPAAGQIGIQLEGTAFKLRNLRITALR